MIAVDWGEALRVAGVGFGMVIGILAVLGIAVWITGILLHKIGSKSEEESSQQKTGG